MLLIVLQIGGAEAVKAARNRRNGRRETYFEDSLSNTLNPELVAPFMTAYILITRQVNV